jgi:hypothetical protein
MSHELPAQAGTTIDGRVLGDAKCTFPARELLAYRRRLLNNLAKLPENDDSSDRAILIRRSLRYLDKLGSDHQSIHGCSCFYRARQARIQVEALRRERRESQAAEFREIASVACR